MYLTNEEEDNAVLAIISAKVVQTYPIYSSMFGTLGHFININCYFSVFILSSK